MKMAGIYARVSSEQQAVEAVAAIPRYTTRLAHVAELLRKLQQPTLTRITFCSFVIVGSFLLNRQRQGSNRFPSAARAPTTFLISVRLIQYLYN